jgi:4-hydroxyacetophenone monooxygenase
LLTPAASLAPGEILRVPREAPGAIDRGRLERALERANLPTLVMVLFQLTGDARWLEDPFRPTAGRGLSPHDDGGFPGHVARELREATADAVVAWAEGTPAAVPAPDPELLQRMLTIYVGEEVPDEYERLVRAEMALEDPPASAGTPPARDLSVVVVGAGLSGLIAAVGLQEAGIEFSVLERDGDVGGVWRSNTYPGAGVDTPSFLYSCSFFPRRWSTHFGKRDEMAAYTSELADHFGLRPRIALSTTVHELLYEEDEQRWTITATGPDGSPRTYTADAVISAVGTFNTPSIPDVPGLERFEGTVLHSAEWPADLDLTGKRVAVVGAGASAQQVAPAIVDRVASLHVLQRSPQWIGPNAEYFAEVGEDVHWLMEHVPYYFAWYRARLMWTFNDRIHASLQIDPDWPHPDRSLNAINEGHRRYFLRYLEEQLEGRPDLQAKCRPTYPPFGKRMLLDNGWFAMLRRPNVTLDTEPIVEITPHGVRTSEQEHEVDVIVFCTGFQVRRYLPFDRVRGRGGRTLREDWGDDDASAHLGMTIPGYPNLFLMYGPNTNAGAGGSVIFIAECQGRYIVQLLRRLAAEGLGTVECRPEALRRWVEDVDAAHGRMVWSHPGMTTYYRNSKGRVVTNSPYRIVDYWAMTREPDPTDFTFEPMARRHA